MYTNDTELHCCSEVFRMIFNLIFADYKTAWLQINRLMFQSIIVKLIGSWQKLWGHSASLLYIVSTIGKALACVTIYSYNYSTHYLGILIDQHLNWKTHVDQLCFQGIRCKLYPLCCLKTLLYRSFVAICCLNYITFLFYQY